MCQELVVVYPSNHRGRPLVPACYRLILWFLILAEEWMVAFSWESVLSAPVVEDAYHGLANEFLRLLTLHSMCTAACFETHILLLKTSP